MDNSCVTSPAISVTALAQYPQPFYLLTSSLEKAHYYQFYLTKVKSKSSPTFIESPNILPLSTWCIESYKQCRERSTIISDDQKIDRLIQVIRRVTNIHAVSDCIQIANTLSTLLYKIHIEDDHRDVLLQRYVAAEISYDTIYRAYLTALTEHHEIDTLQVICTMTDSWMRHPPSSKTHWIFTHPGQLPARYRRLYEQLHKQGIAYAMVSPSYAANYYRIESYDTQLGYHDFIRWYKSQTKPIVAALVVPHLSSQLTAIDRVIKHWQYHYQIPPTDIAIVAKRPLSSFGITQTVYLLMDLYHDSITIRTLIDFVRSPYVFSTNRLEKTLLLQALEKLANSNDRLLSIESLQHQLPMMENIAACPITHRLLTLLKAISSYEQSGFFQHIQSTLVAALFPVAITPAEDKAYRVLNQLLLSCLHSTVAYTAEEGLIVFKTLCQGTMISTSDPSRPIQIIDLSQVPMGIYPYIWYANLDEEQLQIDSTARITDLMQASPHIVLQYARYVNNCEQNIAPSIADYWQSATPLPCTPTSDLHPLKKMVSESYTPTTQIPLTTAEKTIGTYHLKTFQQCPFKAFTRYRLHCPIPEPIQFGFSAKDRGIILHSILQGLFQTHPSNYDLAILQKNQKYIDQLIITQLKKAIGTRKQSLNPSYLQSEQKRLRQLMDKYIEIELSRPPFVVRFIEKRLQVNIHTLTINGIIDRVDEVNGQYILIDYKTGYASHHEWFGDFLDPQLPCYAHYFQAQAVTASLALFSNNTMRYTGVSHEDHPFFTLASRYPNIATNWPDIQEYWQEKLHQVAKQYQEGILTLTTHKNTFCQNCHYQRLCRVWADQGSLTCSAP